jgi:hypothetical protein
MYDAGATLQLDPVILSQNLILFSLFVEDWVKKNMNPLDFTDDLTFQFWIEHSSYSGPRAQVLIVTFRDWLQNNLPAELLNMKKVRLVKAFIKDEFLMDWKTPRGIYSRSDQFKIIVGPIFKAIETRLFCGINTAKYFIKKIPVQLRAQFILDNVLHAGGTAFASDYTSFEAHFTSELMESCENILYDHMVSGIQEPWFRKALNVIGGENHITFKWFDVRQKATRMSGEMNTSLGNGFTNLMVLLYLSKITGNEVNCVVEGDDALAVFNKGGLTNEDFRSLGLTVKLERHDNPTHASFCGLVFDIVDKQCVTDVVYTLSTFGWGNKKYSGSSPAFRKTLLKAKALSMAAQFPGCPVLSKLAFKLLKQTGHTNIRKSTVDEMDSYHKAQYHYDVNLWLSGKVFVEEPGANTRKLVEDKFNVSITLQYLWEQIIDSWDGKQWLHLGFMDPMPKQFIDNFYIYVGDEHFEPPPRVQKVVSEWMKDKIKTENMSLPEWVAG